MRPSADVLAALFENAPRFVVRLQDEDVASYDELLDRAEQIAPQMPEDERLELIDGHPRIGAAPGTVSATSFREQGYDRLPADADTELAERLERLNSEYERRFGFRFCIFVAGRSRSAIADIMESRLRVAREEEMHRALSDVFLIARSRLEKLPKPLEVGSMKSEIYYGKADVSTYRTYGTPLVGVTEIPESSFVGRSNILMAASIEVQVLGTAFLAAYTEGDNRLVVATDTMKNFIHRESLAFDGTTLEQWLMFIGRRFLETYPHMERLRVSGVEIPFEPALIPSPAGEGFEASEALFAREHNDRSTAWLELERSGDGVRVADHGCGRQGLQLMKITGSAFADFARDEYTTLPERKDRPLYVHVDVGWKYTRPETAVSAEHSEYIAGEQVADLCGAVFHRFVSLSIQHLVNEMGHAMLDRWPQMAEVSFEAQNRLWDLSVTSEQDERIKVYTDPRPPYGKIGLILRRD